MEKSKPDKGRKRGEQKRMKAERSDGKKRLVNFFSFFLGAHFLFFLTGSLRDYIRTNGKMEQSQVIDIASQLLSGLNHIHCSGIIHRDV